MLLTVLIAVVHLTHRNFRNKCPYEHFEDTDSSIIRQATLTPKQIDITPKRRILPCDRGNVCDLRLSTIFWKLKLAESDTKLASLINTTFPTTAQ